MTPRADTTADVRIEPMTLDDIAAVMNIDEASFPRPWPAPSWQYEIRDNRNARCVVARTRVEAPKLTLVQRLLGERHPGVVSTVVGMACMWVVLDEAHIATIASALDWRGRGVGRAILKHCIAQARAERCHSVVLEVRVSNHIAQTLYKSYGFEITGERKRYYSDNQEDALVMTVSDLQADAYARKYF